MKKFLVFFFVLFLASIFSLSAAGRASAPRGQAADTRTVVDQNGNTITLPATIERVAITSPWPLPSVYALFMGSGERIVGIHPAVQSAAEFSFLMRVAPQLATADTGWIQGTTINIEALMNLNPCVVFIPAGNEAQRSALESAGIPAVAFSVSIAQWNTIETINLWVQLLGEIFGDELKADYITSHGRMVEEMVLSRTRTIPQAERPRTLILFRYDYTQMQTMGPGHFGQYWLDTTGAISVSEGFPSTPMLFNINMEQVLAWDPEVILITNFSPALASDFLEGEARVFNDDWSAVRAVRDRRVYKFPMGMYRWYPPSSDSPLTLLWLAQTLHPELFADIDLHQEIRDFYQRFYGLTLTDADLHLMLNPPREAARDA